MIVIDLCVNAGANGMPTGRCSAFSLHVDGREVLVLWAVDLDGPRCAIRPERGYLRLAGKRYPIQGHRPWVGSWTYDRVGLAPDVAAAFLNDQRASGWWSPDHGESVWWDRWEAEGPMLLTVGARR